MHTLNILSLLYVGKGVISLNPIRSIISSVSYSPLSFKIAEAELCVCNLSEQLFEGSIKLSLGHKELAVFSVCLEGKETKTFKTEVFPCEDVKEWNPETPELYYV